MLRFLQDSLRKRFPEPYHCGTCEPAASAVRRQFRKWNPAVRPVAATCGTSQPPDIPMQFENTPTACGLVQPVHILCNQCEARLSLFKLD